MLICFFSSYAWQTALTMLNCLFVIRERVFSFMLVKLVESLRNVKFIVSSKQGNYTPSKCWQLFIFSLFSIFNSTLERWNMHHFPIVSLWFTLSEVFWINYVKLLIAQDLKTLQDLSNVLSGSSCMIILTFSQSRVHFQLIGKNYDYMLKALSSVHCEA